MDPFSVWEREANVEKAKRLRDWRSSYDVDSTQSKSKARTGTSSADSEVTRALRNNTEFEKMDPKRVAFFAGLSEEIGPLEQSCDLVFDKVITNVGSAYSSTSGRFTAPVRGTYQFNVAITNQRGYEVSVNVMKSGKCIMSLLASNGNSYVTSSNVAILSLEPGEQVWLIVGSQLLSYLYGEMFTTFSGSLMFQ